jgi:hypothetical protein
LPYFKFRTSQVTKQVTNINEKEAVNLLKSFQKEVDSVLEKLSQKEQYMLEHYYELFKDEYGKDKKLSKKYSDKLKDLTEAQIEMQEVGEGFVELRVIPHFYESIFASHLPEDYSRYLQLRAKEEEVLYAADAGLVIDFKELGNRVITWEQFLKKYPRFELRAEVLELYKMYQRHFLMGMDNTPVRDYETNKVYEEVDAVYDRFLKKNPNSPTSKLIPLVRDPQIDTEQLYQKIETEQATIR